jgi:hypothetical protein
MEKVCLINLHTQEFKHPSSQTGTFISPIECHRLLDLWTAVTNEPIVRPLGYLRINDEANAHPACTLVLHTLVCGIVSSHILPEMYLHWGSCAYWGY